MIYSSKFSTCTTETKTGKKKKKHRWNQSFLRWYAEEEAPKGTGRADNLEAAAPEQLSPIAAHQICRVRREFADWFHGLIRRIDAELLLRRQQSGTFLTRMHDGRFGYTLSLMCNRRCKHFMIDFDDQDRYILIGNDRTFATLNELVAFHMKHPIVDGDVLVQACPVEGPRQDLADLLEAVHGVGVECDCPACLFSQYCLPCRQSQGSAGSA